jgi:hypothetical protein
MDPSAGPLSGSKAAARNPFSLFSFCLTTQQRNAAIFGSVTNGGVAEWLCSGLQSRQRRFDSDPRLHKINHLQIYGNQEWRNFSPFLRLLSFGLTRHQNGEHHAWQRDYNVPKISIGLKWKIPAPDLPAVVSSNPMIAPVQHLRA